MKASTNISLKERRQFTIDTFSGVDYSKPMMNIDSNNFIDCENFINEDGVLKKRKGFKYLTSTPTNIKGMFYVLDTILVFDETSAYIFGEDGELLQMGSFNGADFDLRDFSYTSENAMWKCYYYENKYYFIGNGRYLVLKPIATTIDWASENMAEIDYTERTTIEDSTTYSLVDVLNERDTYVPTTTASISNTLIIDDTRLTLDMPNLLNRKRRNSLLGETVGDGERPLTISWLLDTKVEANTPINITIKAQTGNFRIWRERVDNAYTNNLRMFIDGRFITIGSINDEVSNSATQINLASGYLDEHGQRIEFKTEPLISSVDNIIVEFTTLSTFDTDIITKSTSSCMFGVEEDNSLFIGSSKKEYTAPKRIYYSAEDDLTYFPDLNYIDTRSALITAFAKYTDNTMLAFSSDNKIMYISGTYIETTINDVAVTTIAYRNNVGQTNAIVKNQSGVINFDNNTFVLTQNDGLCSIKLSENININKKILITVTEKINSIIKKWTDATVCVNADKLYISSIENNTTFVTKSSYKYTDENGYVQYNWFKYTNICLTDIVEYKASTLGTLFYTANKIQQFTDDYYDKEALFVSGGGWTIDATDGCLYLSNEYQGNIAVGDVVFFKDDIFYNDIDFEIMGIDTRDNGLSVNTELYLGEEFYFRNDSDTDAIDYEAKYRIIGKYYKNNITYYIFINTSTNELLPATSDLIGITLHRLRSHKSFLVVEINENGSIGLEPYKGYGKVELALFNNNSYDTTKTIEFNQTNAIASVAYTKAFDLGTNLYSKNLYKIAITTTQNNNNSIQIGYQTKHINNLKIVIDTATAPFNLGNLEFETFSFQNTIATTYIKNCCQRNFNYIVFKIADDTENGCEICSLSAIYTINKINRGVQ